MKKIHVRRLLAHARANSLQKEGKRLLPHEDPNRHLQTLRSPAPAHSGGDTSAPNLPDQESKTDRHQTLLKRPPSPPHKPWPATRRWAAPQKPTLEASPRMPEAQPMSYLDDAPPEE